MTMTIRDKLWLFASRAHDDDIWLGKSCEGRFQVVAHYPRGRSDDTGCAEYHHVNSDGVPAPYSADAYGYAESFYRMKNVVWSVTSSAGFRAGNEEEFICRLAVKHTNITGAYADDFLGIGQKVGITDSEKHGLILEMKNKLNKVCRKLDMWLTVYARDLQNCDVELFGLFDALAMWTWNYHDLKDVRNNFELLEKKFPSKQKYLGIYILDYPSGEAIPNEYMELQCEYGLELLKQGRADGMIFLTNCVMGVGLPSELWLRDWIDRIKNIEIR